MFSTDIWIFSVFILFVFSIVLFLKKSPIGQANKILALAFVFMAGSNLSIYLLHYGRSYQVYSLLSFYLPAHTVFALLIAPGVYFYTGMLFHYRPFYWKELLPHYVPALLPGVFYLIYFTAQPGSIRINILLDHHRSAHRMVVLLNILFYVQSAGYYILCFRKVSAQRQADYVIRVNGEQLTIRWLCYFFLITLVGLFIHMVLCCLSGFNHCRIITGLCLYTILAIYLTIHAAWNSNIFVQHFAQQPKATTAKPTINCKEDRVILDRLTTGMQTDKLYLSDLCCIQQVADKINVSRHQLSRLINKYYSVNFNDYINEYRVNLACQLLQQDKEHKLMLEVIGSQCGFGSKTNFNRAFKHHTGKTPKEYQRSISK
jgi:AraC-like DNA-binding protein